MHLGIPPRVPSHKEKGGGETTRRSLDRSSFDMSPAENLLHNVPTFVEHKVSGASAVLLFAPTAENHTVHVVEDFLHREGFDVYKSSVLGLFSEHPFIRVEANFSLLLRAAEAKGLPKDLKTGGPPVPFRLVRATEFEGFDVENPGATAAEFFSFSEAGLLLSDLLWALPSRPVAEQIGIEPFETMVVMLRSQGMLETCLLLHDDEYDMSLYKRLMLVTPFVWNMESLRRYLGEHITFYYMWLRFYMWCLIFPAVVGTLIFIYQGTQVRDSILMPFYTLALVAWAALFLKFWQRESAAVAVRWGSDDMARVEQVRWQFYGTLVLDPLTGTMVKRYPWWKRFIKQCCSALLTLFLLGIVVVVMMLSLNMQGYIRNTKSFAYIPALSRLATPGTGLFAQDSYIFGMIPVTLHVVIIQSMNLGYRWVAARLTEWENYRTEHQFEVSLMTKRFIFEALDCYLPLFWIAFFSRDIQKLREELMALFLIDEIRRVFMETIVPFFASRAQEKYVLARFRVQQAKLRKQKREERDAQKALMAGGGKAEKSPDRQGTAPEGELVDEDEEGGETKPLMASGRETRLSVSAAPGGEGGGEASPSPSRPVPLSAVGGEARLSISGPPEESPVGASIKPGGGSGSSPSSPAGRVPGAGELEKEKVEILKNIVRDEFLGGIGTFDDYMELVIQFGYITLFACAFPLAGVLALLANYIEAYSDLYKHFMCYQRPRPSKAEGIGMWMSVMQIVMWAAVVTNTYVFTYSSDQASTIVKGIVGSVVKEEGELEMEGGATVPTIRINSALNLRDCFFFSEHILFIAVVIIWFCVPSTPSQIRWLKQQRDTDIQRKRVEDKMTDQANGPPSRRASKTAHLGAPSAFTSPFMTGAAGSPGPSPYPHGPGGLSSSAFAGTPPPHGQQDSSLPEAADGGEGESEGGGSVGNVAA
uniref:Anoctamin transmembrane domain-containing protein n=1 Tax=Chromera velia CCMP2878 TaxID=1169474 RepID=A0A0G4HHW7_9ALVE|eukprot:Cvel_27714.t1-p1 / transcript=Cvel_27714.t1 / gene=Cvel_27714 / organism=Chromera_velia_CCMP2878 / gene_product=Anoctamin-10, putative / transcript_product=Anoctamin-10, putative / location=Cvel_scaffold3502:3067-9727(+) / protein_length=930 / sequence_SO=supercontig / SO=protein_coding / is_pseudo=false